MNTRTFFVIIVTLLAISCNKKRPGEEQAVGTKLAENQVYMSNEQLELSEVETGRLEKRVLSELVECNGTVEVPPGHFASVHPPMGGYISEAFYYPGNYVEKGTILAVLEHADYINLQRDYLEIKSQLAYYEKEYRRQEELALGNAASLKQMQLSEAEYASRRIRLKALESQLSMLGISADKITADNISAHINLRAPINGYIVRIEANIGKYADASTILYELVDKSHLHLNLRLFEKDVSRITKGQKVDFFITGFPDAFSAEVEAIGQLVTDEARMVDVHCHIANPVAALIPGMYVRAVIHLRSEPVYSLPVTSLVREDQKHYVFIRRGNVFNKVPVNTGIEQDEYIEILHPPDSLLQAEIVTKGAYYIAATLSERE